MRLCTAYNTEGRAHHQNLSRVEFEQHDLPAGREADFRRDETVELFRR